MARESSMHMSLALPASADEVEGYGWMDFPAHIDAPMGITCMKAPHGVSWFGIPAQYILVHIDTYSISYSIYPNARPTYPSRGRIPVFTHQFSAQVL